MHPFCSFSVHLNGLPLARFDESVGESRRYELPLPGSVTGRSPVLSIKLETHTPATPVGVGLSSDRRLLGVGVVSLQLLAAPEPASARS